MAASRFPEKIVSGGQTGVDRAALDAALALGIPCGGWCPKGRKAEDGAIPERYPVAETESAAYEERTRLNVGDADATLILASGPLYGGTGLTAETAVSILPCPEKMITGISGSRSLIASSTSSPSIGLP